MSNWEKSLNTGIEAAPTVWGNLKKILYDSYLKKIGKKGIDNKDQLEHVVNTAVKVSGLTTLKEAKMFKPLYDKLISEGKTTIPFGDVAKFYVLESCIDKGLTNSVNAMCGVDISDKVWPLFDIDQKAFDAWEEPESLNVKKMLKLVDDYHKAVVSAHDALSVKHNLDRNNVSSKTVCNTPDRQIGLIWGALDRFRTDTLNEVTWAVDDKIETSNSTDDISQLTIAAKKVRDLKRQVTDLGRYSEVYWAEVKTLTIIEERLIKIFNVLAEMKSGTEHKSWVASIGNEPIDGMTVDSVMGEWTDAIKGWMYGDEYTPGNEDDDNKDMGEVSDGNHTFNELYEHRTTLFSIILNQNKDKGWKSKLHDDGTMFDNYFIAGITTPEGEYTYHQHMDWWNKFDVEEREKAPAWDGHKPEDITRLYSLLK